MQFEQFLCFFSSSFLLSNSEWKKISCCYLSQITLFVGIVCYMFHIHPNKLTFSFVPVESHFSKLEPLILFSLSWLVLTMKSNNLNKYCWNIFSIFIFVSHFSFFLFENLDYLRHELSFFVCFRFGLCLMIQQFICYLFSRPIHIRIQCDLTLFFYFDVSFQVFLLSEFDLSKAFCPLLNSVLPLKMCKFTVFICLAMSLSLIFEIRANNVIELNQRNIIMLNEMTEPGNPGIG